MLFQRAVPGCPWCGIDQVLACIQLLACSFLARRPLQVDTVYGFYGARACVPSPSLTPPLALALARSPPRSAPDGLKRPRHDAQAWLPLAFGADGRIGQLDWESDWLLPRGQPTPL